MHRGTLLWQHDRYRGGRMAHLSGSGGARPGVCRHALVSLDRGRDGFEGLAGEAGEVEVAGVVEADEGPGVEAAALRAPAPVGDAGVEGVEEDAVAGGADAEGEEEGRLQDAAVADGDDGLAAVLADEAVEGDAGAGGERGPALPTRGEGGEGGAPPLSAHE